MTLSSRVQALRQASLDAHPRISSTRASLMTAFYQTETGLLSTPVFRAKSFEYLLQHESIYIGDGELIVGEKGPEPKACPTFPELCCHNIQDLKILDSREKTPFAVDSATLTEYERTIIPFWQGKTMREKIFQEMTPAWVDCYEAGIYTEFMEQRAPGHTVLDGKIYRKGMLDFIHEIEDALAKLDYLKDPQAYQRQEELKGNAHRGRSAHPLG